MNRVFYDTSRPGVVAVVLEGEHELYGALKLREFLESSIADAVAIVIDLTRAEFIDSSVVGLLIDASKLAAEKGVEYSIVVGESTGEPVHRMFEVTGLTRLLPLVEARHASPGA